MATVAIVGDGPAGLSAALFIAKNGHAAVVFGQDQTAMHHAQLYNYLGIEEVGGTSFQAIARGQVAAVGAQLRDEEVIEATARDDGGFEVRGTSGSIEADWLVLAGGKKAQGLAAAVGAEVIDGRVVVDTEYRTTVDGLYAIGRVARPERSQAIISAGAGATAALDILSREAGRDVHDWDTPPER